MCFSCKLPELNNKDSSIALSVAKNIVAGVFYSRVLYFEYVNFVASTGYQCTHHPNGTHSSCQQLMGCLDHFATTVYFAKCLVFIKVYLLTYKHAISCQSYSVAHSTETVPLRLIYDICHVIDFWICRAPCCFELKHGIFTPWATTISSLLT